MRALILPSLLLSLTACATETVVRDECHLNAAALEPRACPAWAGKTYRDLAEHALDLQAACKTSEADKASVKQQLADKPKEKRHGGP